MEYSEAKKLVKARLSEKRWTHTKNVKKMAENMVGKIAKSLKKIYNESVQCVKLNFFPTEPVLFCSLISGGI